MLFCDMCNVGALNPVKSCSIIFNKNHWMGANFWIFSPWYFWQPLTHPMEAARRTHGNAHIGPYIMGGLICSQGHFVWNTCATDFGDLLLEVIQSINTIEHSIVLNNCKDCKVLDSFSLNIKVLLRQVMIS